MELLHFTGPVISYPRQHKDFFHVKMLHQNTCVDVHIYNKSNMIMKSVCLQIFTFVYIYLSVTLCTFLQGHGPFHSMEHPMSSSNSSASWDSVHSLSKAITSGSSPSMTLSIMWFGSLSFASSFMTCWTRSLLGSDLGHCLLKGHCLLNKLFNICHLISPVHWCLIPVHILPHELSGVKLAVIRWQPQNCLSCCGCNCLYPILHVHLCSAAFDVHGSSLSSSKWCLCLVMVGGSLRRENACTILHKTPRSKSSSIVIRWSASAFRASLLCKSTLLLVAHSLAHL